MESRAGLLWQPMAPSTGLSRHVSLMDICPVGKDAVYIVCIYSGHLLFHELACGLFSHLAVENRL